jgi:hypothetical protein
LAFLKEIESGARIPLKVHHVFGRRQDTADTHIAHESVSKLHAAIEWNGEGWQLRSFGRNGSWVNQRGLETGSRHALLKGDVLHFGDCQGAGWQVADLSPPCALLLPIHPADAEPVKLQPFNLLPDNDKPEIALYFCTKSGQWLLDSDTQSGRLYASGQLANGDTLRCANTLWQLFLPGDSDPTVNITPAAPSQDLHLFFEVSADEESTQLRLKSGEQSADLGERAHHYLLMHLARLRAQDAEKNIDPKSQGWIDCEQLATELGLSMTHVNMLIFRARKQLSDQTLNEPREIPAFERRRGYLRFAGECFTIYKASSKLYEYP